MPSMNDSEQDQIVYKVVINHEEQYSIWPADRENPLGWRCGSPIDGDSQFTLLPPAL
jgi:uncharacterized protein YbdZ (MbtH family)